jgi:DNA-binding GntR family transcriptional regulator
VKAPKADSVVERVYDAIKSMTINFQLMPGERLNEVEIAGALGVSRTPLREALNRLNTEGFLSFRAGRGFFCRELAPKEIFDLYEIRKMIEVAGVRLSAERASDDKIDELMAFLRKTGSNPSRFTTDELVDMDEHFHETLAAMSGNAEILRILRNVNARIRFVRWVDMDSGVRKKTQTEHRKVLARVKARDADGAAALLTTHIDRRLDEITAAIRRGYGQIFANRHLGLGPPP